MMFIAPIYVAFAPIRSSNVSKLKIALAAASLLMCGAITFAVWGLWSGRLLQPDDETVIVIMAEMAAAVVVFAGATLIFGLVTWVLRQHSASAPMVE